MSVRSFTPHSARQALQVLRPAAESLCRLYRTLERRVRDIWAAAVDVHGGEMPEPAIEYRGDFIGGGYGVVDDAQRPLEEAATRATGLLFDPTYTGKALYGLHQEVRSGRFQPDEHVVFWHTGGGFAALI